MGVTDGISRTALTPFTGVFTWSKVYHQLHWRENAECGGTPKPKVPQSIELCPWPDPPTPLLLTAMGAGFRVWGRQSLAPPV